MGALLAQSEEKNVSRSGSAAAESEAEASSASAPTHAAAHTLFRKGDAWSLTLEPKTEGAKEQKKNHLELTRILRNEFPHALSADILFTAPGEKQVPYTMHLSSTTASASATTSSHRRANPSDPSHVSIPFAGKLVEVLVDEGDSVKEGDVICVVQQMKMELEVRSARSGLVTWVCEAEDGDEVGEGTLAATIVPPAEARL